MKEKDDTRIVNKFLVKYLSNPVFYVMLLQENEVNILFGEEDKDLVKPWVDDSCPLKQDPISHKTDLEAKEQNFLF